MIRKKRKVRDIVPGGLGRRPNASAKKSARTFAPFPFFTPPEIADFCDFPDLDFSRPGGRQSPAPAFEGNSVR
jgi:hypothetical protein